MPDYTLRTWIARHIRVRHRLERVCTGYLLFLMVVTTKHTLEEAARFSRLHKSQFSKLLKLHHNIAAQTLERLSKQQAKRLSLSLEAVKGLPWKIVIIIDSTLQSRSSLHPENAKKFNHGQGFVIGHQWTNVVLILNGILMPLRPIPFYSQRYCREHDQAYLTEHERVVNYLSHLNLDDYIGPHRSRDVVVLTDSGYDNKKIETTIADKQWAFIIALSKTRSVKSETLYHSTPKSKQWVSVDVFFRRHRRLKWSTIRLMTNGTKAKRKEFRIRHTMGYLRYVGWVHLVCSEPKKRSEGRRRYLACNDVRVTARQIMLGYRLRWAVEVFQSQDIKFIRDHFFFLLCRNRWFFKGQHVVHVDRPIRMHHDLFYQQSDHCLAVLKV
jgi:Transposase DDE domain